MLNVIVFTYGVLTSVVLSGASRNRKLRRPNPLILTYVGFVCFGFSIGLSALMTGLALWKLIA